VNNYEPRKIVGFNNIDMVACGGNHTAFMTRDGDIYTFGNGEKGQLGHGKIEHLTYPKKIEEIPKVVWIACGGNQTIFVSIDRELYLFGYISDQGPLIPEMFMRSDIIESRPKRVDGISNVKFASCSGKHVGIATYDGDIYTFGRGHEGQLGTLPEEYYRGAPKKVEGIPAANYIFCSYLNTAVITKDGEVYTFGDGAERQLGYDNEGDDRYTPKRVNLPEKAIWVSYGFRFCAVVTQGGKLYTFGNNNYGQLGYPAKEDEIDFLAPGIPEGLEGGQVSYHAFREESTIVEGIPKVSIVACGENFTAFVSIDHPQLK
jgi:X-linked retinitis pigmentosa GTPase regulator